MRICSGILTKFQNLCEECVQEEERIIVREEKLNENEDQDFAVHTKGKNNRNSYDHPPIKIKGFKKNRKVKKGFSSYECFTFQMIGPLREEQQNIPGPCS